LVKPDDSTTQQIAQDPQPDAQPPAAPSGPQPKVEVDGNAAKSPEKIKPDKKITLPEKPSDNAENEQPEREKTTFELELEAQIAALKKEGQEFKEQNTNLLNEQRALNANAELLGKENRKIADLVHKLEEELKAANNEVELLRADNERLRTYIATKETELQPRHPEDYYVQNFQELRTELEMWIAKQAKTSAATGLSDAEVSKLLVRLAGFGRCGKLSAETLSLNNTVQKQYSATGSRIQLIRHIVAVFLFDQVFSPFVVGLSRELSEALGWIEDDILSQGGSDIAELTFLERQFNETLMIHQSLGLSTVRYSQQNAQYESDINTALVEILRQLVPRASDSDLYKNVSKFVIKAITLKKTMSQEQAVYRCYWVNCGDRYNPEFIEAIGEGRGPVSFCTFPGLKKFIKKDNAKSVIQVVKACAVVQSPAGKG
jgi:hypothetical protein